MDFSLFPFNLQNVFTLVPLIYSIYTAREQLNMSELGGSRAVTTHAALRSPGKTKPPRCNQNNRAKPS